MAEYIEGYNGCEDEPEEEIEEEVFLNPRHKRLCRRMDIVLDALENEPEGSQHSRELNDEIERLSRSIAEIEKAAADRASKEESEVRANELRGTKGWEKAKTLFGLGGMLVPIGVEIVRQISDQRKVDKTMQFEGDGNIWKTEAKRFIK